MLKTPRYYITRPRRRRTGTRKQIVKKELQKEKVNVKGKLANDGSDIQEGKDAYQDIFEKFKKELKSCSITLFNIDIQAAVLTYKPTNKSFLYKISANSYQFRKSSPRGRKRKRCNMNTKYHVDSKNNTGSSSAFQGSRGERQLPPYPVPRKQCAKKSTTQLVKTFQPNNANHSNSGWNDEVMPGKRKRLLSDTYMHHPRLGRHATTYDTERDQELANGEERPWSGEQNHWQNNTLNHGEQYHEESRSQRNNYRDYSRDYQDHQDRDKRHDGRRHSEERDKTYQSERSYQRDYSEFPHSDNSGRSGRYTKRDLYNRERSREQSQERSQERVPLWRDGTLSNRGKFRYGRCSDEVNAKPATRSRDSSPSGKTKSTSGDSNPEARNKNSTSSSKTQNQRSFRRAKDKDTDCGNQGDPTSATKTDQSNKGPNSKLANSTGGSEKEKKSSTSEPSCVNITGTTSVTGAVSKTSTSNAPKRERSSITIAETNGINSPVASQSKEENNIPSASKEAQSELEHSSKSHGIEGTLDPVIGGLQSPAIGATKFFNKLDSANISSHNTSDEEQVKLSKVMPAITNESASKGDIVSSEQRFPEKFNLNTLPSVTEASHITSANPEDSFKDVSLHAVVPGERTKKLKGPSLIQENDKIVDLLDLETPDECKSSPARPDSSARETTNEENEKNLIQNSTVDIPAQTRFQLQEVPSPPVKVDPSEGSMNSFFKQSRLKLKSIVDKVFPKSNASSVTKDESSFLTKSLPASPKTSGEDIEVDSKNQKSKISTIGLQKINNEVTTEPHETSRNNQLKEPSSVIQNISSLKDVSVLPVCQSSMGTINVCDSIAGSEFPVQQKKHLDESNELAVEGIKEADKEITYSEDGYYRPKPAEEAIDKLSVTSGKEDSGLCIPGSLSTSLSLDKDCGQAAQTNLLPNLRECLDDRTNITDSSFDQSNSDQVSNPRPLDPAAVSQEPSAMDTTNFKDSRAIESPMPSDVQAMEVDSLPPEECGVSAGTTTHTNEVQSTENATPKLQEESGARTSIKERKTLGSVLDLVISQEVSLRPTGNEGRAEMNPIPLDRPSAPVVENWPSDTALSVDQIMMPSAGLAKTSLVVQEDGAATTSSSCKVPEEPACMDAKGPEVTGDTRQYLEVSKSEKLSSLETGKRARSPSLEGTAAEGEEENGNKKAKLGDSSERIKGDQRVAEDGFKDPKETMQPVKTAATSSEPVASTQPVKTAAKSLEPLASTQPVKTAAKSSEPVASMQPVTTAAKSSELVASTQPVKTAAKSSELVASTQPVTTAAKSSELVASTQPVTTAAKSSEIVASTQPVKTAAKPSEPVAAPQPVKTAAKPSEPVVAPQPVKTAAKPSEPVAAPQPVKTAAKPSELVAAPQPVKTAAKPSEPVACSQPVKTAAKPSEPVAAPQPVKTAAKPSEPVASTQPVKTAAKPSEPVAAPQPVKPAAKSSEPVASPSNQVEKVEPAKPGAVPRKSSSTPPLSQTPSPSGAPARRTGKPKQMTTKDLRLMIEKHAQASLQSHLELLRRQLEVSSKGEQMWETRSVELQKQLEIVQRDNSRVKEEGDSLRAEIAELHICVENLTEKLQEKGVAVKTASSTTQYDDNDFTEGGEVPAGLKSSEKLPVSNPIVDISHAHQQLVESGIKQTVDASMIVAEAPAVANATCVSSANANASPLVALLSTRQVVMQPGAQQQSTPQESVTARPSATLNLQASKQIASIGDAPPRTASSERDSASTQPQVPPTKMIYLEKLKLGIASVLPPKSTQHAVQGISNTSNRVTSVQIPASSGALILQAPGTTAVVTNTEVALARKVPTPEIQEVELPSRSTPGKQRVPSPRVTSPRVRQSQSPQTQKTGSPGTQTPPRGLIPITSHLGRATATINVSILPNVSTQAKVTQAVPSKPTRPQKVTTPVTKQQTSMQSAAASQKAAASPQANPKTTAEPELIDLTGDIEEPNGSVGKQPSGKAPLVTSTNSVASMIQPPQSTVSKRAPPPYTYHQTPTSQIHNAAPSNTQGPITRRPAQQQEGQSPHKLATQMVRPHAQQPRHQGASPRHFTAAAPNRTVGSVRYRMPTVNLRPGTSRLPQVSPMVSAGSAPQATAHSTLNTTQVTAASTSVRYINPALMANVALNHSFANTNTTTAVPQQAPIATNTVYPMSSQQIRSVAPILQGMAVPIVSQGINNMYFPSAVQAGIPAGRLPQQAQGVRAPQNTIAATQVATQLQQQQMQQHMQLQQQQQLLQKQQAQQQLLQKHQQAQQQQAQQQQAQQQQAQQQQAQQQQAQQQQAQQQQAQQQQAQQQQAQQQQAQQQQAQQQQAQQQQAQQQQAQQHQQIQQQLIHQRLHQHQHQQKARAAEEQRQQANQQQHLQLQMQQQQANQAKQQQLQVQQHGQKLQSQQLQQQCALIQQTVQKVHSATMDLKKKLDLVNKEILTVQAKLHNKENMTYHQRDLEIQLRLMDGQKQQLQSEINKSVSLHQQHQQTYERLMTNRTSTAMNANPNAATKLGPTSHPAPLPALPPSTSKGPPKPELNITKVETGIVLSWNMTLDVNDPQIDVYHLYAYQESEAPATTTLWKKIGEVRALPLPMACTLTMFQAGSVYHFAVCAVDVQGQSGPFSDPASINLPRN